MRYRFAVKLALLLQLAACPLAAADAPDLPITNGERATLIEGSIEKLKQFYVFPDTATKLERVIRSRASSHEFRSISSGTELARTLTNYLQDATHDKHLRAEFFPNGAPPSPVSLTPTAEELEAQRLGALPENFGFEQARHLPGNVGYLEIRGFYTAAIAAPTASAREPYGATAFGPAPTAAAADAGSMSASNPTTVGIPVAACNASRAKSQ
jgi:retinol-binding protein 3